MANSRLATVWGEWGLLAEDCNVSKYSIGDWKKVGTELDAVYGEALPVSLSAAHLGTSQGLRLAEGHEAATALGLPAMMFDAVWLPDPLFSALSCKAFQGAALLPEARSSFFGPGAFHLARIPNLWAMPPDSRRAFIRKEIPRVLAALRTMLPLLEGGALRLYPWELVLLRNAKWMKEAIEVLKKSHLLDGISTAFRQGQYNQGPRASAFDVQVSGAGLGVPDGTPLWFGEKTPIVLNGLINAATSLETASSAFMPDLPGDRIVYDFIRTGGLVKPQPATLAPEIVVPRFSEALWPDIVKIREDSESLSLLRALVRDVALMPTGTALPAVQDRIREVAESVSRDRSIWKACKDSAASVFIGTLAAGGATALIDLSAYGIVVTAVSTGVATFLGQLFTGERSAAKRRAEVFVRIGERLAP